MASFTDQISTFNPYIQQLPVEAMVQVGQQKQAQYDAGVQKIQGYIDNIAGMDVANEADKAYLQSKLNQLGSKLKTVAAGDFSNQQLVNSVGGMTTQIVKDSKIQNAVYSTQVYRKGISEMDAARKEGKSSASNIDDFNEQAKVWLNSTTPGEVFRGAYQPYTDVSKKVMDVIGKLHPKSNSQDIAYAYKTNKDGSIDIAGILDGMKRQGIKTVDEGQIRTALSSILDANDYNQLAIDGRYNYKSIDQKGLLDFANTEYKRSTNFAKGQLNRLNKELLQTTNADEQERINDNILHYQKQLGDPSKDIKGSLDENYNRTLEEIATNPNAAKGKIYTNNYLNGIANGFAYAEVENQIVDNPIKENFWKKKNYEQSLIEHRDLQANRASTLGIQERAQLLDEAEFQQKYGPSVPYFKTSGDPTTNDLTALQNYTDYNNKLQDGNNGILMDLAQKGSSITTQLSPDNIKATITKYKNNQYVPATQYEKAQMDKYIANENLLANQEAVYKQYEDKARNEVTGGVDINNVIGNAIAKKGDLVVGNQRFTAREVYDYLNKEREERGFQGDKGGYQIKTINDAELTNKERLLKNSIKSRYDNRKGISTGKESIDKYLSDFSPVIAQTNEINRQVLTKVAQKMAPITGIFQTQQAAVTFKDENAKKEFVGDLVNIAKADLDQKTGDVGYQPKKLIDLLTKANVGEVEIQFKRSGDNYYAQVTDKNDPKGSVQMKVDADFVARSKQLGSGYLTPNADLSETLLRNAGTTNMFKDKDHAMYQTGKFGGYDSKGNRTVTIPIAADLENQGGQLYPVFRITGKNGKDINFPFAYATDRAEFETKYLPSLTNEKIIKLLKDKYPNIEQLIQY
jgi:hypothetical protein